MKEETKCCRNEVTEPLFTGNGSRDMSVSEYEKAAEVSCAIRMLIDHLKDRKKQE